MAGLPCLVTQVSLPMGGASFSGKREQSVLLNGNASGDIVTTVMSDAGTYSYHFSNVSAYWPIRNDPGTTDKSKVVTLNFQQLDISRSGVGVESYTFDPDHGMAVLSATDLCGHTTTFAYETAVGVSGYGTVGYDDPILQTDALGHSKHFTYDPGTRVMSSITDENGVSTDYEVQAGTGLRLSESIRGQGGTVTTFEYGSGGFAGFMTQKTVFGMGTMPATATFYSPDAVGRVRYESTQGLTTTHYFNFNGNKTYVVDPKGQATGFQYDVRHRIKEIDNPDGTSKKKTYDLHGRRKIDRLFIRRVLAFRSWLLHHQPMATPRFFADRRSPTAYYHCVSCVVDWRFIFQDEEGEHFVRPADGRAIHLCAVVLAHQRCMDL